MKMHLWQQYIKPIKALTVLLAFDIQLNIIKWLFPEKGIQSVNLTRSLVLTTMVWSQTIPQRPTSIHCKYSQCI